MISPALTERLRELDRDDACLQGTPMVPLHRETLRQIIAALAALKADAERIRARTIEECARVCERFSDVYGTARDCASAIRDLAARAAKP